MDCNVLRRIIQSAISDWEQEAIPIGVSNRHVHLCQADYDVLFPRIDIKKKADLKQVGEFATENTVTLVGPRGSIKKVRLLAPLRSKSQVEVSKTDARMLGIVPPIALSGHLEEASIITLKSDFAQIDVPCCIVAKRHIHMPPEDGTFFGVKDGQTVKVAVHSPHRSVVFDDVIVRCVPGFVREMHLDTDEANAADVGPDTVGHIVK